jgi:hypothetical protein
MSSRKFLLLDPRSKCLDNSTRKFFLLDQRIDCWILSIPSRTFEL